MHPLQCGAGDLDATARAERVDVAVVAHRRLRLATYAAFQDAFRANEVLTLDKFIQYPLAYIGKDHTTLVDTFPVQPAALMAAKQWHDTKDLDLDVVFVSHEKAHLIVRRATRVRADGSPIEVVSAFYALTGTPSRVDIASQRALDQLPATL